MDVRSRPDGWIAGRSEGLVAVVRVSLVICAQRSVRTCHDASFATQAAGGVYRGQLATFDLHDGSWLACQPRRAGSTGLAERRFDVEDR